MERRDLLWAGAAAALSSVVPFGARAQAVGAYEARPFRVAVPQATLDGIAARVRDAQVPPPLGAGGWSMGVDGAYLADLRRHWLEYYDWRAAETALNRHPQFTGEVDGLLLDFYHLPGKGVPGGAVPKPVLVVHGWPYSRFSLADLIDRLTDPARFGGDPREALTVVAPSLPGYGFAGKPERPLTPAEVASRYHALMTRVLGYPRFGLQGGDHGCVVTAHLACAHPGSVTGLHLNLVPTMPVPEGEQTSEVKAWMAECAAFMAREFSYFGVQAGRPASLGYAMADSPVGLAAWFLDKFHAWTDLDTAGGDLDRALGGGDAALGRQRILTEIMAYLVSGTAASGIWFYRTFGPGGGGSFFPGGRIEVPTAAYLAHKEFPIGRPPRAVMERSYAVARYTEVPRGAHFPFWETPDPFAADIRAFFGTQA